MSPLSPLTAHELGHDAAGLALHPQLLQHGRAHLGIAHPQHHLLPLGRQRRVQQQPQVLVQDSCGTRGGQGGPGGSPREGRSRCPGPALARSPSDTAFMFSSALCAERNGENATSFTTLRNLPSVRTLSSTCGGGNSGYNRARGTTPLSAPTPPGTSGLPPLPAPGPGVSPPAPIPLIPVIALPQPVPSLLPLRSPLSFPYLRQQEADLLHLSHGEHRVPGRMFEQHVEQHLRHRGLRSPGAAPRPRSRPSPRPPPHRSAQPSSARPNAAPPASLRCRPVPMRAERVPGPPPAPDGVGCGPGPPLTHHRPPPAAAAARN